MTNKLFGFSFGLYYNAHIDNSVRVSWKYDKNTNEFKLYSFRHKEGYMYTNELCVVPQDIPFTNILVIEKNVRR